MEGLDLFLKTGSGDGSGYGDGSGSGSGSGSGDGAGYGDGSGSGDGYGSGSGSGSGDGYGSGSGDGSGSGSGSGDGYGAGDGIDELCGKKIHSIDSLPTIIDQLKRNIAKGFIVNNDLTTSPCYIAKVGNSFAHADSAKEAVEAASKKELLNSPLEDRVKIFLEKHSKAEKIKAKDLFEWHHTLTGSCEFGRLQFAKDRGINIENDSFTMNEFCELVKDSYGGEFVEIIKLLK